MKTKSENKKDVMDKLMPNGRLISFDDMHKISFYELVNMLEVLQNKEHHE